jgi:uncharacterized protein with von Willebrand factor type A (vWA) domain
MKIEIEIVERPSSLVGSFSDVIRMIKRDEEGAITNIIEREFRNDRTGHTRIGRSIIELLEGK